MPHIPTLWYFDISVICPQRFHCVKQRPVTRSFDAFFDLRLNKRLSKNGGAGDLRRHRAHCDVRVLVWLPQRQWIKGEEHGWYIEAETKRTPFHRHFQMHFLEWKCMNFKWDFIDLFSLRVQLIRFLHWFRQWLCAGQGTSRYLNQWW